jgi:hypothetical protein
VTERLWATAAFAALALVVAGPLLGDGYLLLLDFPAGPNAARPSLVQLPSSGGAANVEPLVVLQLALERIDPLLPQRFFLVAPVLAGALGVFRLVRRRFGVGALPAAYGGVLFVVNPFVYDRFVAGHLYFLLAYALLPWAVTSALAAGDEPLSRRRALGVGAWAAVLGAAAVAVAAIYLLVVLAVAAFSSQPLRRRAELPLLATAAAAAASAYWVLPALVAPPAAASDAALDAYASRPGGWAVLPTLAALYGFWRDEFPRAADETPALYLLLLPILALAALGFLVLHERRRRRDALVLAVLAIVALVLAAGVSLPASGSAFRWTYEHTPLLAPFREPQKLVALVALAYAALGAVGLDLLAAGGRSLVRLGVPIAGIVAALAYGHSVLWGLSGDVSLSHYPPSWANAARVMDERGGGALLVLPRDPYTVWSFSDGRIVAHPARSFFDREVISGETASLLHPSRDPFVAYVNRVLAQRDSRAIGRLLAPVDLRFIAVSGHDAVANDRDFLEAQRDLRRVFAQDGFVLYENAAWRKTPRALRRLQVAPPLVERHDLDLPRLDADERIGPLGTPYVVTAKRCTDGWRLGDDIARCQLGAVAAFAAPARREPLWTPFMSLTIIGFAITGTAVGGIVALGVSRHRR